MNGVLEAKAVSECDGMPVCISLKDLLDPTNLPARMEPFEAMFDYLTRDRPIRRGTDVFFFFQSLACA